ncbi:MAG: RidA family protein [Pseudomonadota bacterium]
MGVETGSFAYLSGHTASEFDATSQRIVIKGDMSAQVKTAYQKIGAILEASGRSYADVIRVVEYLKPEGIECYGEAAAVREEVFGAHTPTVNTVPVKSLLRPDALIEIEITAATPGAARENLKTSVNGSESAGVVFLPSILPTDEGGNVIGKDDIAGQTEAIFQKAERLLKALGLGFENVVKTLDYLTSESLENYRATGAVRKNYLGPVYPAAAGILMPRLIHPDSLIQYDFIASRDEPQAVNPGWSRYEKLTYSPGVRAGKLLFLAGQGAVNPETGEVEFSDDVVAQGEYIYTNVIKVIEAAGGDASNLVKTIEYVVPQALKAYRGIAEVRTKLMREPYPASTGLVCAALLRPQMLLEVDPLAILD